MHAVQFNQIAISWFLRTYLSYYCKSLVFYLHDSGGPTFCRLNEDEDLSLTSFDLLLVLSNIRHCQFLSNHAERKLSSNIEN